MWTIFFCPHHPERGFAGERPEYKIVCDCRKPATGMIRQAKEKHDIDLSASWIIGDTCVDVLTGIRAGLHTVLLETGDPDKERLCQAKPEWRAKTLLDAVRLILPAPEKKTPT